VLSPSSTVALALVKERYNMQDAGGDPLLRDFEQRGAVNYAQEHLTYLLALIDDAQKAGRNAALGARPSEASYGFLVQLLWCRGVGSIQERFEEAANVVRSRLYEVRQQSIETPLGTFATAAEGVIALWKEFLSGLVQSDDLNVCFDALLRSGGDDVFRSVANAELRHLGRRGWDFCRVVRAHLLNDRLDSTEPHPGLNQSAETLELYKHLSKNPAFRESAESFRGDYEWVGQDLGLQQLQAEFDLEFSKLSSKDFSGPSEQDEPTSINVERVGMASVSPSREKAYRQYTQAVGNNPTQLNGATDYEVYDWLKEHSEGEPLPTFSTWSKYLREARKHYGNNKNTPRRGRATGKSIVRSNEI
jgi:hypothetical protein